MHLLFPIAAFAVVGTLAAHRDPVAQEIISRALSDGIDLAPFDFTSAALDEIVSWSRFHRQASNISSGLLDAPRHSITVDVHAHHTPNWYRTLAPLSGQRSNPEWTLENQLTHMLNQSIRRSVLSVSSPGANAILGNRNATIAISRLLNENSAALAKALPDRFSFMASIPLPYTNESITEATYALKTLGAVGVMLLSNHEGLYLGNLRFTPFFRALNDLHGVALVHPTDPTLEVNDRFIVADPTVYTDGVVEFYFETARSFMDLAISGTLQNFTDLNFIIPHVGGSLPSIIDRGIQPRFSPGDPNPFLTRCWWDSAGATYAHQLGGLLAYNISPSALLFGSDFPYVGDAGFAMIEASPFLDEEEKNAMRGENVKRLFAGKIRF